MILLIPFAFLGGIVTILSPCILPILPIILSGTVGGGKRKPLGIVAGFILSFTFFTLFLATIVKLTNLSADFLRNISVFIVLGFGITLLLPQAQIFVERLFTKLSKFTPKNTKNFGFLGGFLLGTSLGLIWTPCVGPILASIITLAAASEVSTSAVIITLSYSAGTALPMLAITYGGRNVLQKIPWLTRNTATIQKAFGVLMILTALAIYFNADRKFQAYVIEKFPQYGVGLTGLEDNSFVKEQLEKLKSGSASKQKDKPILNLFDTSTPQAPELIPGGQWLNSSPLTLSKLSGKVVLIDFWTYTCINCIRTLPYLKSWHQKYADLGLVIIGVHTPEFEFEKNPSNLKKAIEDFGLTYPIMQDNDYDTWRAYQNRYWPAKYFIDKNGKIRHTHFGEGAYDESERVIQQLLEETGVSLKEMPINNPSYQISARTPELYLGYNRIEYFASPEEIIKNKQAAYTIPDNVALHRFAYGGNWTVGEERAMPKKGATLLLRFEAKEVFIVMRPSITPGKVRVLLDGKTINQMSAGVDVVNGIVTVDTDRLYKLVKLESSGKHLLELEFLDDNLELYAFTFG